MITSISNIQAYKQPQHVKSQINNVSKVPLLKCDVVSFAGKEKVEKKDDPKTTGIFATIVKLASFVFSIIKSVIDVFLLNSQQKNIVNFNKEWEKAGNKPLDAVVSMNISNLPGVLYNPSKHLLGLNHAKIKSSSDIKYNVEVLQNLIKTSKRLAPTIKQITQKSAEKLDIPKPFVPNVNLYYEESGRMGFYTPGDHYILLNAYHIDEAHDPEAIISEVISHELSHSKSNMDFSIIDANDIDDSLKVNQSQKDHLKMLAASPFYSAYKDYRSKNNPVGEKEYNRIKYHLEKHLSTLTDNESLHNETMKAEKYADRVYGAIKKNTGLGYKELGILDVAQLINYGKAMLDTNNSHAHAQFDEATIKEILQVADVNKKGIAFLLAQLSKKQQKLLKAHMKYQDIYDESIARMNSSRVTGENFKDGTITKTKASEDISKTHLDDLFDLLLRTDDEVRAMVESGDVQLTPKYVNFIAHNQDFYKKLDMSNQKA